MVSWVKGKVEKAAELKDQADEKIEAGQEKVEEGKETYEEVKELGEGMRDIMGGDEPEGETEGIGPGRITKAIGAAGDSMQKANIMILTPHLPMYAGGSMVIDLDCASQSVQIGGTLAGKIRANI